MFCLSNLIIILAKLPSAVVVISKMNLKAYPISKLCICAITYSCDISI